MTNFVKYVSYEIIVDFGLTSLNEIVGFSRLEEVMKTRNTKTTIILQTRILLNHFLIPCSTKTSLGKLSMLTFFQS